MNQYYNQEVSKFAYLLTKDELENLDDQKQFFINNNILVEHQYEIKTPIDEGLKHFLTPEEFEIKKIEAEIPLIQNSYKFNPKLIEEIFNNFYYYDSDVIPEERIAEIHTEINLCFDKKQKKSVLKKQHSKYIKTLKKNRLCERLLEIDPTLNIDNLEFLEIIRFNIGFDDEIIEDYLVNGQNMTHNFDIFNDFIDLKYNLEILKFINFELMTLRKATLTEQQERNASKNNLKSNYHSAVFQSAQTEEIFHKILEIENVIDIENKPKHRFQTVAYNSFKIITRLRDEIFSTDTLKTFVEFLEKKYSFEVKNKNKFGNINDKLSQKIANFVSTELDTLNNSEKPNKAEF